MALSKGSSDPLWTEPELFKERAESAKEEKQSQGCEKDGERENDKRRGAAPFVSPYGGPCCAT